MAISYEEALAQKNLLNICLIEPEIPNNTGNIGRTCVGLRSCLHLVGPLGFDLSEKKLRRAGLDYWPELNLRQYANTEEWLQSLASRDRVFLFTTKSQRSFYDIQYQPGDTLVFGKETAGLSAELRGMFGEQCVKIPMPGEIRSYNLANSVAIASFEAFRQIHKS